MFTFVFINMPDVTASYGTLLDYLWRFYVSLDFRDDKYKPL